MKQMDLNVVDQIRSTFNALPDYRKQGNNQKYAVGDAALSAFSVFFTQSPSFLDYQLRMQKHHNRNNVQSIFGVHQIPSTRQIGNLLDPIAPETLYPMLADFTRTGEVRILEKIRWNGKQRLTERYRYINQVPLRDSDDALLVNGCEVTITNAKQEQVYRNAWATSHTLDEDNVVQTVAAGRARWNVENENNNVLKNHGYHFDPNFAHGKQYLSNFLTTLNLLAFLTHTALEWLDEACRAVRSSAPSRRTFFENLRTLLQFISFDNWQHLMQFMLNGGMKLPVET